MNWLLLLAVVCASAIGSSLGLVILLLSAWHFGKKANTPAATTTPPASLRLVTDDDAQGSAS